MRLSCEHRPEQGDFGGQSATVCEKSEYAAKGRVGTGIRIPSRGSHGRNSVVRAQLGLGEE
ncbi:hypothetical protein GCM10010222_50170 [Streptomyces tanashiensis]|nr:hypothetical protein GCM10010222_50170 [Streptomyces tanashiensis]